MIDTDIRRKKLDTLPLYALYDLAIKKGVEKEYKKNKEKSVIIDKLVLCQELDNREIEVLVENYVYGNRITFTLWTLGNKLEVNNFKILYEMEQQEILDLQLRGFRKLKILSVTKYDDRVEILYVYSKRHPYIDEDGNSAESWEQHRGCIWIGTNIGYLASISNHESVAIKLISILGNKLKNTITKLIPPRMAIERCTNPTAISRVVYQGVGGEKAIFSKKGGLNEQLEKMVENMEGNLYNTAGSYVTPISKDIVATVRFNSNNGSISIQKHLSTEILFKWTNNAIDIIFEEIENLKGKPAEDIFKEIGKKIKWNNIAKVKVSKLNWFLTQLIKSIDYDYNLTEQVPEDVIEILDDEELFIKIPRIYCYVCDSYDVPCCSSCDKIIDSIDIECNMCECGKRLEVQCSEGHMDFEYQTWYIPTSKLNTMFGYNIKQVYMGNEYNYSLCVMGNRLEIIKGIDKDSEIELYFDDVDIFKIDKDKIGNLEGMKKYALLMKEKCGATCSKSKINQCLSDKKKVCLPKLFYSIIPGFRPQPHHGKEYGDVSGQIVIGRKHYEMKGIIKSNSKNKKSKNGTISYETMLNENLLSSSREGQEIIRQIVEQGISDARCDVIAVIVPQYIDNDFKGTLRSIVKLGKKKILFIELDEICKLLEKNEMIEIG